jgi:hypothetical protein
LENPADVDRILAEFYKAHKEGTLLLVPPEEEARMTAIAHADYERRYGPLDPVEEARVRAIVNKKLARIRAAKARGATRKKAAYSSAPTSRPTVPLAASA